MSFTKVAPTGIGTSPGNSILIGDSLLHSTGIDIGSNTGIGVTIRKHGDATFTGIITASAFFGDGSGLEGVSSSGIGTPLSDDDTSDLNKIYYVNQELSIGSTVTVNHPSSAVASYTHYQDLVVTDDADFIVSDGDTFIPDVLGIRTSTSTASAATGGRIRAGTITNAGANGAPNFPNGLTGTAGTFTGNLNVGGVLTYEDVTNVDSIGIVTARGGIRIGTGGTVGPVGSGIVTYFGDGSQLSGISGDSISEGNTKVEAVDTGSDGHVKITTEGSERLRINSSGQLLLGTTTPGAAQVDTFTLETSGHTGMTFFSGTSNRGQIAFGDGRSGNAQYRGVIMYEHSNDSMRFATADTTQLNISSDGHITMPNRPIFSGRANLGNSMRTATETMQLTSRVNVGGHWSNSNYNFTCPVTGYYFMACSTISNVESYLFFRKDTGSGFAKIYTSSHNYGPADGSQYRSLSATHVESCNVGDKLDFYAQGGYYGLEHGSAVIYLLA